MANSATLAGAVPAAKMPQWMKWAIAATASLGAMMEIVDTSIVNVALTDMQSTLGATLSEVGWVITSYAIANVVILPMTAWLGYRFGKSRYFVFSMAGFTIASVLCGLSNSLSALILARILQGLTGGGLLAKAQAILFETFDRDEQPMAQALFGIVAVTGPVIGPTLGGYIVTNLDWRWIFFINVPIGTAAVFLAAMLLPKDGPTPKDTSVDVPGIVLLFLGIGSLQTVLEEGQSEDWFESKPILFLAITAVVSLVAFVWHELRTPKPIVDLRVLRHRSLAAGSVFSLALGATLYGAMFAIPVFAQTNMHMTAQQTGILLLPGALTSAFMMPIAARFAKKYEPRVLIATGACILLVSIVLLGRLSPQTGEDQLFWPMIIRSVGTVLMFLPLSLASIGPLPPKDVPAGTAFSNLTRQLGGSIGVAFLTTLLSRRIVQHRSDLATHLGASDVATQGRLTALTQNLEHHGFDLERARHGALVMMDGSVSKQASVMAFNDTFFVTAIVVVCTFPLIFFLGKPKEGVKVDAGH